jgi:hypothetical protein
MSAVETYTGHSRAFVRPVPSSSTTLRNDVRRASSADARSPPAPAEQEDDQHDDHDHDDHGADGDVHQYQPSPNLAPGAPAASMPPRLFGTVALSSYVKIEGIVLIT